MVIDIYDYKKFTLSTSIDFIDEKSFISYGKPIVSIGQFDLDTSDYSKWSCVYDSNGNQLKSNHSDIFDYVKYTVLLDNINEVFISNGMTIYRSKNINSTTDYIIKKNKLSGEYEAVEKSSYFAEKQSLTLQPINR